MNKSDQITIAKAAFVPVVMLIFMWLVHWINVDFDMRWYEYGIYPRDLSGLVGVLAAPFLHSTADIGHIINNSVPLFILGWTLFYFYRPLAFKVLLSVWFIGGSLVWMFARESHHVGMSGVVYGLWFFIFFSGVFRREKTVMAVSLFAVFLYGSMVWGIFPIRDGVSFESHLFGGLIGTALALLAKDKGRPQDKKKYQWEIDEEVEAEMLRQGYTKIVDPASGFTIRYEKRVEEDEPSTDLLN